MYICLVFIVVFKFVGGRIKNSQFESIQNKKPYDKPQKSAKSIGAQVFASYPQPLIGNIIILLLSAALAFSSQEIYFLKYSYKNTSVS